MKRTFLFVAASMLLASVSLFADRATVIDFTLLEPDCVSDEDGNPTQNSHTVMDFSKSAGTTFTDEQREIMKTSLALPEWEVTLNSSARNVKSLGLSTVVAAPVSENSKQDFAGKSIMGVRVVFPEWNANACAYIRPPFDIPAYEPLASADENGDRQEPSDEEKASGKTLFEDGYGVVKNVGVIKSIAVTTLGMNFPEALYVLLKDTDGVERRYFMGYLAFDGWKELRWDNPQYISEVRNREIRIYPIYPRGMPFVKFSGFQIVRDANHIGGDYIGYFKDVKIIYDNAVYTTERDIADEDLWGIITKQESERQAAEMARFGDKQINRYLLKQNLATEDSFDDEEEGEEASENGTATQNSSAETGDEVIEE
ncbi:MAG: flagellar protein [Treponema sp.]|nr:flagellar protein [Treponema sp.]